MEQEPKEDLFCAEELSDVPELLDTPDAEKLLGLPLAVYPGEMEDDPGIQVHPKGRVGRSPGTADSSPAALLPESKSVCCGWIPH